MKRFLAITRIWILAIPFLFTFAGAASNQLVLAANHDKFPVMVNQYKIFADKVDLRIKIAKETGKTEATIHDQVALIALNNGYLDDIHVIMSDSTHLNFLADYIDFRAAIYSPGDLLLETGDYLQDWAFPVWGAVLAVALYKRDND